MNLDADKLTALAEKDLKMVNSVCVLLKGDGSARQIYKIFEPTHPTHFIAGVVHTNLQENLDFLRLTTEMRALGIPTPEILAVDASKTCYLLEYLGAYNLAEKIEHWIDKDKKKVFKAYQKVIDWMPKIQFELPTKLQTFFQNRQMGYKTYCEDIGYWEKNFLEKFGFIEAYKAEIKAEVYNLLLEPLKEIASDSFVYRDFQSRNFMWVEDSPIFIDYQSAYLGPFYYDLASMLYASRSGLDEDQRKGLIRYYYERLEVKIDFEMFVTNLYRFVLLRRLRSLGSYGYLGCEKKKDHFLNAITPTLIELLDLFETQRSLRCFKHLRGYIELIRRNWKGEPQN